MNIPILDLSYEVEALWDELNGAIQNVLKHGQFIFGPEVKEFEQNVADYLGAKHAIGVNSGTDALVIGMRAAGIGEGDEVITTPFSFFATAESISIIGAKPVFVDIQEDSFNLDPDKIEELITPKTKAILPVHLYGNPAAMSRIMKIAEKHDLKVIEDCAQSFGATYHSDCERCEGGNCNHETLEELKGKQTGVMGLVGAYSFFPTKNLGGYGDGGLIVTDDDEIADQAAMLRTHGSKKKYYNEMLGYNSRLDTIQAAILDVKLKYIDEFNRGRRRVAKRYIDAFEGIDEIITPSFKDGHVFHQFTIRIQNGKRDSLEDYLREQGIGSMVYYPVPQDQLPIYKGKYPNYPVSDKLTEEVLSLPIWPQMEEEMQDRVIEAVREGLGIRD